MKPRFLAVFVKEMSLDPTVIDEGREEVKEAELENRRASVLSSLSLSMLFDIHDFMSMVAFSSVCVSV